MKFINKSPVSRATSGVGKGLILLMRSVNLSFQGADESLLQKL